MSKINFNNFFLERDKLDINWEYVWELPHFREMEKTQQNPRWHMEGNVMQHTRLVCENMMTQLINDERCVRYSFYQKKLLMLAALFHDIGKPQTTFLGEKDGNWHSYGHDVVGAKLAREMLWDWPLYEREFICSMIKHHMEPLFVHKSNNVEKRIKEITSVVPYFDLYLLKCADLEGALQNPNYSTKVEDREKLEIFLNTAESPYAKESQVEKYMTFLPLYTISDNFFIMSNVKDITLSKSRLHVMIGLPGSGKNTYIDNVLLKEEPDAVILSRDDIRVELGYCTADEKIVGTDKQERKVTDIFNKRLIEAMENRKSVIINNINLSKKRRKALLEQVKKYNPYVIFHYIEAPTLQDNLNRRDGQIKESVFHNMIQNFDFPEIVECDKLVIYKQTIF